MSAAYHNYYLTAQASGAITGRSETNDDNDDGVDDGAIISWPVQYVDYATMIQRTGGSHVGISGVIVQVFLDGKEIYK